MQHLKMQHLETRHLRMQHIKMQHLKMQHIKMQHIKMQHINIQQIRFARLANQQYMLHVTCHNIPDIANLSGEMQPSSCILILSIIFLSTSSSAERAMVTKKEAVRNLVDGRETRSCEHSCRSTCAKSAQSCWYGPYGAARRAAWGRPNREGRRRPPPPWGPGGEGGGRGGRLHWDGDT